MAVEWSGYVGSVITHFADRRLRTLHLRGDRRSLPPALISRIQEILDDLDSTAGPEDMNLPKYRLHRLSGDMAGCWSVWVSGNGRIVFRFDDDNVRDVRLIDYH